MNFIAQKKMVTRKKGDRGRKIVTGIHGSNE